MKLACEERESAESIIRYNSYIDRMLIDQIQDMNEDVRKRLQNNIKKLKLLKVEQKNIDDLVRDLNMFNHIKPLHLRHYFAKKEIVDCLQKIKEECNEI